MVFSNLHKHLPGNKIIPSQLPGAILLLIVSAVTQD
jgi:hypothetical protein